MDYNVKFDLSFPTFVEKTLFYENFNIFLIFECSSMIRPQSPTRKQADEANNMAVPLAARVLCLWSVTLITVIFLVVRADGESKWNFFLIFIPVLVYDGSLMIAVLSRIIRHSRRRFHDNERSIKRKLWFLLLLILNFIFVCLVCSKLDGHVVFSWYYVFIVLWTFLILVGVDATRFLRKELTA